jgi:RsiW-degrading membrane proteinase PrsW (M82 family)
VLWLALFYSRDRYEKEPKQLIAKLFGAGVVSVIPAIIVTLGASWILTGGGGGDPLAMALFSTVVLAPLLEEPTKAGLALVTSRNHSDFDEPVDGMIYFTTVGLGFGAIETTFYLASTYLGVLAAPNVVPDVGAATEAAAGLAVLRGLTSTMAHGLWSGLVGYFYARRRFDPGSTSPWIGLVMAIGAHALWNFFAPQNLAIGVVILVLTAVLYFVLFERAVDVSPHRPTAELAAAPALAARTVMDRRPCPRCGNSIASSARMCRYCRTRFDDPAAHGGPAGG